MFFAGRTLAPNASAVSKPTVHEEISCSPVIGGFDMAAMVE